MLLGSQDRFIRFAARVALEHQPVEGWAHLAFAETDPQRKLELIVALARCRKRLRINPAIDEGSWAIGLRSVDRVTTIAIAERLRDWC